MRQMGVRAQVRFFFVTGSNVVLWPMILARQPEIRITRDSRGKRMLLGRGTYGKVRGIFCDCRAMCG